MINEEKLLNILFEGNENLVVQNDDRFHLEDYIQYFNKPGIIVATIKGDSECGIQQLPVGAVDNFRFMQVTDESAITEQEKNNGKTYETILKEYECAKNHVIDQWKKMNGSKYQGLKNKYGEKFLGMDIKENKKKIEHKEDEKCEDEDKGRDKEELKEIDKPIQDNGQVSVQEGILGNMIKGIKNWITTNKDAMNKIEQYFSKEDHADSVKNIAKDIQSLKISVDDPEKKLKIYDNIKIKVILPENQVKEASNDTNYFIEKGAITTMNYNGKRYIVLKASKDLGENATLKDFYDTLKKNGVKKMAEDVNGLIVIKSEDHDKTQLGRERQENAVLNGYPVSGIETSNVDRNGGYVELNCDIVTINKSSEIDDIDSMWSTDTN